MDGTAAWSEWTIKESVSSKLRGWKYDFLEKSVGDCTTYDVIAPWPVLIPRKVLSKVLQRKPHYLCKISARPVQRFGGHLRIIQGGWINHSPPSPARARVKGSIWNFQELIRTPVIAVPMYISGFLFRWHKFRLIVWCDRLLSGLRSPRHTLGPSVEPTDALLAEFET